MYPLQVSPVPMLKAKCWVESGPCEATSCFKTQTHPWDDGIYYLREWLIFDVEGKCR